MSKVATPTIWNLKYLENRGNSWYGRPIKWNEYWKKCLCFLIMYCNKYKTKYNIMIIQISSQ